MGVQISESEWQFWGKEEPIVSIGTFCCELCKNSWNDRFAVWFVDSGGPKARKHIFARWRQCAHMGRHIGATWRIRLNRRPSVAAVQSYVKLLWPLVYHAVHIQSVHIVYSMVYADVLTCKIHLVRYRGNPVIPGSKIVLVMKKRLNTG